MALQFITPPPAAAMTAERWRHPGSLPERLAAEVARLDELADRLAARVAALEAGRAEPLDLPSETPDAGAAL